MLDPLAGFFQQRLRGMQIVAGRDDREEQQNSASQRQKFLTIRVSGWPRAAPQEDQKQAHAQREPDQIEQQLHKDAWVV